MSRGKRHASPQRARRPAPATASASRGKGHASPRPSPAAFSTGHGDVETSLVLVFPLLLAYAVGVLFVGRVNGADVITRSLYGALGRTPYLLVYAAASILFLMWVRREQRSAALRIEIVGPVVLEASIYAFTLGAAITLVVKHLLGLGIDGSSIVSALGAGVHEELVFRLGLFAGLVALLRGTGRVGIAVALVISSVLFAAAHHIGAHGEPFTMHAFVFRSLAGAAFATIFWFRSLAHAVYAHALYDLVVAAS
jgi:hypothetical protein